MLSSFDNDTKIYGATNHHSGVRITGREVGNEYVDGLTIFHFGINYFPHIILLSFQESIQSYEKRTLNQVMLPRYS